MRTLVALVTLSAPLAVAQTAGTSASLPANSTDSSPRTIVPGLNSAVQFRADMASSVKAGAETPAAALTRLNGQPSPLGLGLVHDAEYALAAIDIGTRLVRTSPTQAEQFFGAAEKTLLAVIKTIPDSSAQEKAQYLQALAHIEGRYLNKPAAARLAFDQAINLWPSDPGLRAARQKMASEQAEYFQSKPKG